MGLSNSSGGGKTFINIVGGKFAIKAKEGAEGAVSRENKNKQTVWEHQYNKLENVILTGIEKKISDAFGASWEITLKEADETFLLNLSYSGRQTNGLLFRLPNIDFSQPITLSLFTNNEGKTFLTVYDKSGAKIEPAYSKDNQNGLPELEKRKIKGVDTWDDTKQMEFIEQMIETQIQPKLKAAEFEPEEYIDTTDPDLGF
jgi:hypothetical protein